MKQNPVIYPFLFAAFQFLFLFSHNIAELSLFDSRIVTRLFIPLLVISCATLLIKRILHLFIKDFHLIGILLFLLLLTFFSYGHFDELYSTFVVEKLGREVLFQTQSLMIGRNKVYIGVCCVFFALCVWFLVKYSSKNFSLVTRFLNRVLTILLLVPLVNITSYELKRFFILQQAPFSEAAPDATASPLPLSSTLPDVYYIILDAYASNWTLKEFYQYDNSSFLSQLKEKGFYIASKSRSNYAFTILSLSSSLNMDYLNSLSSTLGASNDLAVPIQRLERNAVMDFFKSKGYKLIHIQSGWLPVKYDRYLDKEIDCDKGVIKDSFMKLVFETTVLKPVSQIFSQVSFEENVQRDRILCQFAEIPQKRKVAEEPQFIFAHVPAPHWPYVFDENGGNVSEGDQSPLPEKQKYIAQLTFINKKVLELIENILLNSQQAPIIILQADHGSWNHENWQGKELYKTRMRIFNAYYLPDGGDKVFYDSITPVNSFRLIFNHYFGMQYEQLEDRSYYSWFEAPYNFIDVTDRLAP